MISIIKKRVLYKGGGGGGKKRGVGGGGGGGATCKVTSELLLKSCDFCGDWQAWGLITKTIILTVFFIL